MCDCPGDDSNNMYPKLPVWKSNIDTKKLPCLKGELPFPRPIIWGPPAISELGGVITWVMWCRILFIPKHHMEVTYPYSIRPKFATLVVVGVFGAMHDDAWKHIHLYVGIVSYTWNLKDTWRFVPCFCYFPTIIFIIITIRSNLCFFWDDKSWKACTWASPSAIEMNEAEAYPLVSMNIQHGMNILKWNMFGAKFPKMFVQVPSYPIPSMYDIFTYIWLMFTLNVGKYKIQSYGYCFFLMDGSASKVQTWSLGLRQPKHRSIFRVLYSYERTRSRHHNMKCVLLYHI